MSSYVHVLIVLASLFVFLQIPAPVPCLSSTRLPPECPPGPPGIAQQGEPGEDGMSCNLVTFPSGQVGCWYPDNSESIADPTMEKYFARINPERFVVTIAIIFLISCLFGFGLWMYSGLGAKGGVPVVRTVPNP